eukprot:750648-Hanusia_phi.AAC.5
MLQKEGWFQDDYVGLVGRILVTRRRVPTLAIIGEDSLTPTRSSRGSQHSRQNGQNPMNVQIYLFAYKGKGPNCGGSWIPIQLYGPVSLWPGRQSGSRRTRRRPGLKLERRPGPPGHLEPGNESVGVV